jgi:hypothetical protein
LRNREKNIIRRRNTITRRNEIMKRNNRIIEKDIITGRIITWGNKIKITETLERNGREE